MCLIYEHTSLSEIKLLFDSEEKNRVTELKLT